MRTDGDGVPASDESAAAGGANRGMGEGMSKPGSLAGKTVEVGRVSNLVPIAAEVWADILGDYPNDVGFAHLGYGQGSAKGQKGKQGKHKKVSTERVKKNHWERIVTKPEGGRIKGECFLIRRRLGAYSKRPLGITRPFP